MPAPTETLPALVLRTVSYGESDLVVHLFAKGRGKLGAFARGARRSTKRFGGGIEPFSLVEVEVAERRGADLFDLRSAQVVDPHLALRDDLSRLAHAGYATELVREVLRDREPNDRLFQLLLDFLGLVARSGPRSILLRAFELDALGLVGLSPLLDHCVRCGADLTQAQRLAFDPLHGGAACLECAGPGAVALDQASLRLLLALQRGGLAQAATVEETGLPLDPVRRALRVFVDHHVRHDLRSLAFLREVGAPL